MTGPKHLWSGDWESESAAAAAERRASMPQPPEERPPSPPERPAPSPRSRRLFPRAAVLLIAAVALVLAGGAYAVTSLRDSDSQAGATDQPAWLGVQLLGAPGGAVVAGVTPGSPAQFAGLRPGDVITEVQGRPVGAPVNVVYAVEALSPGETLELEFFRRGTARTVDVKLAARPAHVASP